MKRLTIIATVLIAALPMSANAKFLASKASYAFDQSQLSDPSYRNRSIDACSHSGIQDKTKTWLAKLMNVPEDKVRFEFCRRVITAYAQGTISYDDYIGFANNHKMPPSILKALGISQPRLIQQAKQAREEITLPVSVKMTSGEVFAGKTVAAHGLGRFLVQSTRHPVKCTGSYDLHDRRPTVTLPVKCSDGRTGQATITRKPDMMSAVGKVKLSDGSIGEVKVGAG